ncbi:MAG: hypothetical protein ACXWUG_26660 [Polyangiales bacterium]
MEQPFDLRVRKGRRALLALLGAMWIAIGVASAAYVARSSTGSAHVVVDSAD